jgi:dTDP-4-dehydrorhamnose 3,5-epimerase
MKRIETALPGVCILEPRVFEDERGAFFESWRADEFARIGISCPFVQDNHSFSRSGVLRGLHYQRGRGQAKLIRVVQGEVFDVAVDIRRGSPTFGLWAGEHLSASNRKLMFIPAGFAHGFLTISDTAELLYKCSEFYAPAEERGILWNDPSIGINWPLAGRSPVLNARDAACLPLSRVPEADLPAGPPVI